MLSTQQEGRKPFLALHPHFLLRWVLILATRFIWSLGANRVRITGKCTNPAGNLHSLLYAEVLSLGFVFIEPKTFPPLLSDIIFIFNYIRNSQFFKAVPISNILSAGRLHYLKQKCGLSFSVLLKEPSVEIPEKEKLKVKWELGEKLSSCLAASSAFGLILIYTFMYY